MTRRFDPTNGGVLKSARETILEFVRMKGQVRKGELEDEMRTLNGSYGDTTARRARELVAAGEIIKTTDALGITWYADLSLAAKTA